MPHRRQLGPTHPQLKSQEVLRRHFGTIRHMFGLVGSALEHIPERVLFEDKTDLFPNLVMFQGSAKKY